MIIALMDHGSGEMPADYIDFDVMRAMGWSYQQLMECPEDMFTHIVNYLNTERQYQRAHNGRS